MVIEPHKSPQFWFRDINIFGPNSDTSNSDTISAFKSKEDAELFVDNLPFKEAKRITISEFEMVK
jgi:hypothetical protein